TTSADLFTYTAATGLPTVTSLSPSSGPTRGSTSVTITGTNFTDVLRLAFGSATATFTVNSATSITAIAPAGTAGTVDVTVTTPGGTSATASGNQFQYVSASAPTVSGISPAFGPMAGGTSVTLTGVGITGATQVLFDGVAATGVTVVSDTQITATAPAHAAG